MVEQQMSEITGIEFCEQAIALFPEAKRILLTDVETDTEMRQIKPVNFDCYLLKLSYPPEDPNPIVQDLLDEWLAVFTLHDVYLVGDANSAGQAAMYFSKYARSVTILVRGDSLTKGMSQYLIDQIEATENITIWLGSKVVEVKGENHLEAIAISNTDDETQTVPLCSLFLFIGAIAHTDWLADIVQRVTLLHCPTSGRNISCRSFPFN